VVIKTGYHGFQKKDIARKFRRSDMAKVKVFKTGDTVKATGGKHTGKTGAVMHSDKSITTVKFDVTVEPVWTNLLVQE
jgi:hypothetical protein